MVEIRRNPFIEGPNEWILVSPNRMSRVWSGQLENTDGVDLPEYDSSCPLCPGNTRQSGEINPVFEKSFVFLNDTPAFSSHSSMKVEESDTKEEKTLFDRQSEDGISEVFVYTPIHNKPVKDMTIAEIEDLIKVWSSRYWDLGKLAFINHVAQFETCGKELGSSFIHPHGQIWAQEHIPPVMLSEVKAHKKLSDTLKKNAMVAYLDEEIKKDQRVVYLNDSFGVVVPYWATWPYETLVIPVRALTSIDSMTDKQVTDLAKVFKLVPVLYSQLFERQNGAPYIMAIHQSPTDASDYSNFQMHIHFSTNLLTSSRQKFHSGYGEFFGLQRDLTPELAASRLKDVSTDLIDKL